jgi:hypothetical protein
MIKSTIKYLGDLSLEAIHLQSGTVIMIDAPVRRKLLTGT